MVDSNLSANFRSAETAKLSTKRVSAPDPEHPFQTRFPESPINPWHRWFAGGQPFARSSNVLGRDVPIVSGRAEATFLVHSPAPLDNAGPTA